MSSTRPTTPVVGYNGIVFTLQLLDDDGTPSGTAQAFDGDLKSVTPSVSDRDDVTFGEVKAGDTKDETLTVAGVATYEAGSLFRFLTDNPGKSFACVYGPHGNAVPTASKPHRLLVVKNPSKPIFPQTATSKKERVEFSHALDVVTDNGLDES